MNSPEEYVARYKDNFQLWAFEVLDMSLSEDQEKLAKGLQKERFVAGKSGTTTGKGQPLDEPVLTPSGFRPMGSLSIGDYVVGKDGNPTEVIGVFPQGKKKVYKFTFSDGSSTRCDNSHLWLTKSIYNSYMVKSTEELINTIDHKHSIPYIAPKYFADKLAKLMIIMDVHGEYDKDSYLYKIKGREDAESMLYLIRSLGGWAKLTISGYIRFILPANTSPFSIKITNANYSLPDKEIVSIDFLGHEETQCIKVAAEDSLYITKDFIVTHNTSLSATIAIWFLTTRPEAKIVCTAPTGHQLHDLLLSEIRSWIRRIKIPFVKDNIVITKDKIYIKNYEDWFIVARTIPKDTKDKLGDVLAGFHAPYLLFIVDESSGVADPVFAGLEGSMIQRNVYCLLVGNPTRPNGFFYDCFHKNRDHWHRVTLSSTNSPMVDQEWIERMKMLYGEDSDWYKTKVLGDFPSGGGLVVASYDQLEEAFKRWEEYPKDEISGPMVAGLDPSAGRNDSSILTFRQNDYVYPPLRIPHLDGPDLIPKVITQMKEYGAKELYIDYTGIGVILYDIFRKTHKPFKVYKVVSSNRANNPEAYRNLRAELYKQLSDTIDELALPRHERYVQELPEISFMEDKELFQVTEKHKLKQRLGFSPDFSDSLMVSTYRNFNLGVTGSAQPDIVPYTQINSALLSESSFEKI